MTNWGRKGDNYYKSKEDSDDENEYDEVGEAQEAARIQEQQLADIDDDDYFDDEMDIEQIKRSRQAKKQKDEKLEEVVSVPFEQMDADAKDEFLTQKYPHVAKWLRLYAELQSQLPELDGDLRTVVCALLANLAVYFAMMSSPDRDTVADDHPIIDRITTLEAAFRGALDQALAMDGDDDEDEGIVSVDEDEGMMDREEEEVSSEDEYGDEDPRHTNDDDESEEEGDKPVNPVVAAHANEIAAIEDALVADKPWQLRGEVNAAQRPKNSLISQVLDFDMALKRAPEPSETLDSALEEMIKRRIRDREFDDPVQRAPAKTTERELQEAQATAGPQKSLAEVYEDEFAAAAGITETNPEVEALRKKATLLTDQVLQLLEGYGSTSHRALIRTELTVHSEAGADITVRAAPGAVEGVMVDDGPRDKRLRVIAGRTELTAAEKKARRSAKKDRQKKRNVVKKQDIEEKTKAIKSKEDGGEGPTRREDAMLRRVAADEMKKLGIVTGGDVARDKSTNYLNGKSVFDKRQAQAESG